ncbi:MAG: OmpA family protein [Bacteroidota bacterium]
MKNSLTLSLLLIFLLSSANYAQFDLKKLIKKTKEKTEEKVEKKIEDKIDKATDEALEGGKEKPEAEKKQVETATEKNEPKTSTEQNSDKQSQAPKVEWKKYDFVPGSEIIFEDNLVDETNGEFPSRWDLLDGNFEIAELNGEKVISIRGEMNMYRQGIVPYLKNRKEDYLPDAFTLEFDAYYSNEASYPRYFVTLFDRKNQASIGPKYLRINYGFAEYGEIGGSIPGLSDVHNTTKPAWRHIAISFNKRALKVYLDETRVLNIPNFEENPSGITLSAEAGSEMNYFIKNIRLAKGAVPLYDKFLTDGKIVTTGIKFDVNKATIKPESMGVINGIVKILNDHPELKFSVEGHTDSDGDDAFNQKLSEARAQSVMNKLIELGIDGSRLTSKGWGESKPVSDNSTPEAKANNRRVEFVKI